jgi:hypothetical protein
MSQIGRNLTDAPDGILHGKRYLIHDRDPLFTAEFLEILGSVGVKSVQLPPRSPNLKDYASHCTSYEGVDRTSFWWPRSDSFLPWALCGRQSPGCSYRHSFFSV